MIAPISEARSSRDLVDLHALSGEELDALPYGVIALARDATILRYNLAEARFARLDRALVLGKAFFQRVAPCTNTPEFKGRFDALLAPGATTARVSFSYVFDFRFGAQLVDVELVRRGSSDAPVIYVVVDRKKFDPPRAGAANGRGVAQAELAPAEERLGVVRDVAERRSVSVSPLLLEALGATFAREPDGPRMLDAWGFAWGRLAAVEMETDALEAFDRSLRDLPMVTAAETVATYVKRQGWGSLSVDFAHAKHGALIVLLQRSALAEALRPSTSARCQLLGGFFRAVLCHLASKRLVVREVRCAAHAGGDACEFVVVAEARARLVEGAFASGTTAVLERLRRG